jgi:hypothetical protein
MDPDTKLGVCKVFVDGGLDAQTLELGNARHADAEWLDVCIEDPFPDRFSLVKALPPTPGTAVRAGELAGLPCTTAHLGLAEHPTPSRSLTNPRNNVIQGRLFLVERK